RQVQLRGRFPRPCRLFRHNPVILGARGRKRWLHALLPTAPGGSALARLALRGTIIVYLHVASIRVVLRSSRSRLFRASVASDTIFGEQTLQAVTCPAEHEMADALRHPQPGKAEPG